jgi:hypothetical protein
MSAGCALLQTAARDGQQGKRVAYGAAAAFCGAAVALAASIGSRHDYPVWWTPFGWAFARNLIVALCSLGNATFGYLALHGKGLTAGEEVANRAPICSTCGKPVVNRAPIC